MKCACGSGRFYDVCCGVYHTGQQLPSTPLQLMRSRYSAYTQANIAYIEQTQAAQAAKDFNSVTAKIWAQSVDWRKLEVLDAPTVVMGQVTGWVTFKAHYIESNKPCCIHERSCFQLIDGRWYYVSGVHLD